MLSSKNMTIEDIEKLRPWEITGNIAKKYLSLKGNYKTSDFSIKNDGYALNIDILNPEIDRDAVENIVKRFENIYYDEATGEILSGGNFYVFVDYKYGLFDNYPSKYEKLARYAIEQLGERSCDSIQAINKDLYLMNDFNYNGYQVRSYTNPFGRGRYVANVKDLASTIYRYDCSKQLR